jgi:hypothetical protein
MQGIHVCMYVSTCRHAIISPLPLRISYVEDTKPMFAIPDHPKGAYSAIGKRKPPPPPPPPKDGSAGDRKKLLASINAKRPSVRFTVSRTPSVATPSAGSDDTAFGLYIADVGVSRGRGSQHSSIYRPGSISIRPILGETADEAMLGPPPLQSPLDIDAGYSGGDDPSKGDYPKGDYLKESPRPESPFAQAGLLGDIAGIVP